MHDKYENMFKILTQKADEDRPLRRYSFIWLDNIKTNLNGVEWVAVEWADLIQDLDRWREIVKNKIDSLVFIEGGEVFVGWLSLFNGTLFTSFPNRDMPDACSQL